MISGWLLWLSFANVQAFDIALSSTDVNADTITSGIYEKHQGLIPDIRFEWSSIDVFYKTPKVSFGTAKSKLLTDTTSTCQYELLYFKIGSHIPLQLTTRTRIFPFHCFT